MYLQAYLLFRNRIKLYKHIIEKLVYQTLYLGLDILSVTFYKVYKTKSVFGISHMKNKMFSVKIIRKFQT